jgi:hypothetical protein
MPVLVLPPVTAPTCPRSSADRCPPPRHGPGHASRAVPAAAGRSAVQHGGFGAGGHDPQRWAFVAGVLLAPYGAGGAVVVAWAFADAVFGPAGPGVDLGGEAVQGHGGAVEFDQAYSGIAVVGSVEAGDGVGGEPAASEAVFDLDVPAGDRTGVVAYARRGGRGDGEGVGGQAAAQSGLAGRGARSVRGAGRGDRDLAGAGEVPTSVRPWRTRATRPRYSWARVTRRTQAVLAC